jgi:hypothetical protein
MKFPTADELKAVWRGVLADSDARKALAKLKRDGFAIDHLTPGTPNYETWADYIAIIPFLPNRHSRRQIHRGKTLRKHLSLVRAMHHFSAKAKDPFCEIQVDQKSITLLEASREFGAEVGRAADVIEQFISSNWFTRDRNPRNAVIAALRWMIRYRTGTPHDSELAALIDAALTAANKECIFLEPRTLERIEKRELEGRVSAACRLNYVSGKSPSPLPTWRSTKVSRNRAKPV